MSDDRLEALEQRRIKNIDQQVDNAALQAGSDMYYYCRICGEHVATLPEGWWEKAPPKYCEDCKPLVRDELIIDDYDAWLKARGEKPVPR